MSSARLCLFGLVWASVATAGQIPTEPAEMFDAFCAVCHGEDGNGQVENPAIDSEPMDFTDCAVATPEPDGDWELVITHVGFDVSEFLNTWTLGLELNGVDRNLALTPQLRKGLTRTGAIAVAGGIQIPLTNRDVRRARWVGYFLWEYLDPVFAVKN